MRVVTAYTDGGCSAKTRIGGFGVVILEEGQRLKEFQGAFSNTTVSRMELRALITALENTDEGTHITLWSDSLYAINGTQTIDKWKRRNWMTSSLHTGEPGPVKNRDLWEKIDVLRQPRKLVLRWVKGHSGDRYNERADTLATKAAKYMPKIIDLPLPEVSVITSTSDL